ncbi:MAG: DUF2480 family protein [Gilvibacter sp.]
MKDQIVNRVANSVLVTLDLEELYPDQERKLLDISPWLYEGFVLREKEFRAHLAAYDWSQYKDCFVALGCSSDAIIPGWAYMLIATYLQPYALLTHVGDTADLEKAIITSLISNLDVSQYTDVPVIIKGCSDKEIPDNAYVQLTQKIMTVAKSVMYGEACSAVPLYKRR